VDDLRLCEAEIVCVRLVFGYISGIICIVYIARICLVDLYRFFSNVLFKE
jgi:hypothetical protein